MFIKNNPLNLQNIFSVFKGIAWIEKEDFFKNEKQVESIAIEPNRIKSPERKNIPEEYTITLIRKRYSESTLKINTSYFSEFANHFPDIDLDELTRIIHRAKNQDILGSMAVSDLNLAGNLRIYSLR